MRIVLGAALEYIGAMRQSWASTIARIKLRKLIHAGVKTNDRALDSFLAALSDIGGKLISVNMTDDKAGEYIGVTEKCLMELPPLTASVFNTHLQELVLFKGREFEAIFEYYSQIQLLAETGSVVLQERQTRADGASTLTCAKYIKAARRTQYASDSLRKVLGHTPAKRLRGLIDVLSELLGLTGQQQGTNN